MITVFKLLCKGFVAVLKGLVMLPFIGIYLAVMVFIDLMHQ
ncbi:MAG: hypothetical protein PHH04_03180 [Thomasclavelia sp.]|nr:hypothetical protein [Thomasclavelia sp.]